MVRCLRAEENAARVHDRQQARVLETLYSELQVQYEKRHNGKGEKKSEELPGSMIDNKGGSDLFVDCYVNHENITFIVDRNTIYVIDWINQQFRIYTITFKLTCRYKNEHCIRLVHDEI